MARYDPIVPRPADGSRRVSGDMPDSIRRALYRQMLDEEIGPAQHDPLDGAGTSPFDWRGLIMPVVLMLVLAGMALGGAWLFRQVQSGKIGFTTPRAEASDAERAWRAEDRAKPAEDGPPMESEMEKMLEEQKKPPVQEEPVEASEAVEE